ncbi:MAG: YitT family protein [Bacilli bacterium]|nr:YitT family protein [Bacilli bacterium]
MAIKYTKKQIRNEIKNTLLIVLGSFLVACGVAFFIEPSNLVTGGVTTLGIIINTALHSLLGDFNIVDIVVWVVQILLWGAGFLFLGKRYAMRTLIASVLFPAFNTILFRFVQPALVNANVGLELLYTSDTTSKLLVALFGGLFVGGGIGVAYLGNGSTGGLDIISAIVAKHFGIKEGIIGFALDAALVLGGLFIYKEMVPALLGVLSAIIMGITIQFVYSNTSSHVIFEIISAKCDEIQKYIHENMDHTTTEISIVGGYSKENKTMLRAVVYHTEQIDLKKKIAEIDPNAFIVIVTAKAIKGIGFDPLYLGQNVSKGNSKE